MVTDRLRSRRRGCTSPCSRGQTAHKGSVCILCRIGGEGGFLLRRKRAGSDDECQGEQGLHSLVVGAGGGDLPLALRLNQEEGRI